MQTDADSAYSSYRPDYRAQDRCASAVLSPSPDWIYPNYTVSPQALPSQSGRVQLPSMYTTQRHPDQSYPSPSPSVPSPGPRSMSDSLDYPSQQGSSTPPGAEYPPARESQVGLARQPGARQMSLEYKDHGRRHSGDSQLGEFDPRDMSRPSSPFPLSLSLQIPNTDTMDGSGRMTSPYQPATPNSIASPRHYNDYPGPLSHLDGRLPSPSSPGNRSASGSASGLQPPYAPYSEGLPPSHGKAPSSRIKKHTKKKLDALEKKRICNYQKEHQNARQEDIAEMFGIERSTVSKILKHKGHWLQVDDNAEVQSKNRPSKFPMLEESMRKWLQYCTDRDITVTDSAIRKRALELAAEFNYTEDKFKASAGWIENFKHRHAIRGGKWTQVQKADDPVDTSVQQLALKAPILPLPRPSSSSANAYQLASITHPTDTENFNARFPVGERGKWVLPPGILGNGSGPRDIVQYAQSGLPPPSIDDIPFAQEDGDDEEHVTVQEAEMAAHKLVTYLKTAPEGLVTVAQINNLVTVRCALFQYVSGVPFDVSLIGE